ncbi:hypothetical protein V6D40_04625 [Corynebacterium sp. Q4381]|uniref:hypothetical protein n=1 Tax=Corynebacterium sp. Marseille-Q4381 TaxID=3121597 RepID=UPI002FE65E35
MTPLSSTLNRNFHLGAQDTRRFVWSNLANDWLPTSWQESITQLSYSVTGLWDSVIRAIELVF